MKKSAPRDEVTDVLSSGVAPSIKINGTATDAGLFDHVFDGTDDAYDKMIKMKKIKIALHKELEKRGIELPK